MTTDSDSDSEHRDKAASAPSRPRRRRGCLGCAVVLGTVLVVAVISVVLARHAIATTLVRRAVAEAGVVCTPALEVTLDLDLAHATVAPSRCVLPESAPVLAVAFGAPVALTIEDSRIAALDAERLTVELRHPPPSLPTTMPAGSFPGPLAVLAGARGAILALMQAGARSATREVIVSRASVGDLTIAHDGVALATLRDVQSTSARESLTIHAGSVALEGVTLGFASVDTALTPTDGRTTADIDIASHGFHATAHATLTASGLDTASPVMDASLGTAPTPPPPTRP